MWQQVYAISRIGKRYVKQWVNTSTGQVISNRQYQQRFGSVAKAGFSTIERKTAVSPSAKGTKVRRELFKFVHTEHTYYELDVNGDWIAQIQSIIAERRNFHAFWVELELAPTDINVSQRNAYNARQKGKRQRGPYQSGNIHVQTHATNDIDMMLEELAELLDKYEVELISATFVTIGETR